MTDAVKFPVYVRAYWLLGKPMCKRHIRGWGGIYEIFDIENEETIIDFDPTESTVFSTYHKRIMASVVIGKSEDLYDYKVNMDKISSQNPIMYRAFINLRSKKINMTIGHLIRRKSENPQGGK